jgi:hypothetical protein
MQTFTMSAEPTLNDMLRDLWRARRALAFGAIMGLACATLFLLLAVAQYRASMLVTPTTRSGTPDISALFPNNASFAMEYVMQSFGPGDSSDFMRFETILREPTVAAVLLQDEKIRAGLGEARRSRIGGHKAPATAPQLAAWLQDHVAVEPVGQTRLKRLVLLHPDPVFAAYMLGRLYAAADNVIRAELEEKTVHRIAYLEKTLDKTSHPDHRRVLTQLLMDQEQISMVLAVNEPFAAAVAEPPAAGPRPAWPRKTLVLPGFVFAGAFAAYMIFLLRRSARP